MPSWSKIAVVAATCSLAEARVGIMSSRSLGPDSKAGEEAKGIVSKIEFHRQLVVCNAYPGDRSVQLMLNTDSDLTKGQDLKFKECRNFGNAVHEGDRLGFHFHGDDQLSGGMFRMGDELPQEDAQMLLVVERAKGGSKQMRFQSFVFPASVQGAHVAVIDTYHSVHVPSELPSLSLADHLATTTKAKQTRTENLRFNRVYELEAGTYDIGFTGSNKAQVMHLTKGQDYVFLRTGEEGDKDSELVVFPQESAAASLCAPVLALFAALFAQRM